MAPPRRMFAIFDLYRQRESKERLILSSLGPVTPLWVLGFMFGIAVLVASCSSSSTAKTSTTAAQSGAAPSVSKDLLIHGTVDVPVGNSNKLSIVLTGPVEGTSTYSVPVVVRNNTSDSLERVQVTGTARAPDGSLAGSGSSQSGIQPVVLKPGEYGIGYVYFGTSQLPQGTTFELEAKGEKPTNSRFSKVQLQVKEANLVPGQFGGQAIVGVVSNPTSHEEKGPNSVLIMCFQDNRPTATYGTFTQENSLAAGATGSFSTNLTTGATCPNFVVGSSGYSF